MLTDEEVKAINSALGAVYTLIGQAEDRCNTHYWGPTVSTLEGLLKRNKESE